MDDCELNNIDDFLTDPLFDDGFMMRAGSPEMQCSSMTAYQFGYFATGTATDYWLSTHEPVDRSIQKKEYIDMVLTRTRAILEFKPNPRAEANQGLTAFDHTLFERRKSAKARYLDAASQFDSVKLLSFPNYSEHRSWENKTINFELALLQSRWEYSTEQERTVFYQSEFESIAYNDVSQWIKAALVKKESLRRELEEGEESESEPPLSPAVVKEIQDWQNSWHDMTSGMNNQVNPGYSAEGVSEQIFFIVPFEQGLDSPGERGPRNCFMMNGMVLIPLNEMFSVMKQLLRGRLKKQFVVAARMRVGVSIQYRKIIEEEEYPTIPSVYTTMDGVELILREEILSIRVPATVEAVLLQVELIERGIAFIQNYIISKELGIEPEQYAIKGTLEYAPLCVRALDDKLQADSYLMYVDRTRLTMALKALNVENNAIMNYFIAAYQKKPETSRKLNTVQKEIQCTLNKDTFAYNCSKIQKEGSKPGCMGCPFDAFLDDDLKSLLTKTTPLEYQGHIDTMLTQRNNAQKSNAFSATSMCCRHNELRFGTLGELQFPHNSSTGYVKNARMMKKRKADEQSQKEDQNKQQKYSGSSNSSGQRFYHTRAFEARANQSSTCAHQNAAENDAF